jgi:spore germination cell wall hydrolase CwlJ-like protein
MRGSERTQIVSRLAVLALTGGLGACNTASPLTTGSIPDRKPTMVVSDAERDCLGRAMYFECAVVGQPGQFAPGVLTKPMQERDLQKVAEAADAVLAGERHPKVGKAMYFHTAGHHFPYKNMHYVAVAGGNAFYEKRDTRAAKKEMPASAALPPAISSFAASPVPPAQ